MIVYKIAHGWSIWLAFEGGVTTCGHPLILGHSKGEPPRLAE
jgi:hypothetical protein